MAEQARTPLPEDADDIRRRPARVIAALVAGVLVLGGGVWLLQPESSGPDGADSAAFVASEGTRGTATLRLSTLSPASQEPADGEGEPTELPAAGRGTELFDSLPQQVGPYVLVEVAFHHLDDGALESYSAIYASVDEQGEAVRSASDIALTLGRWATEAEARNQVERVAQALSGRSREVADIDIPSRLATGATFAFADDDDDGELTILWSSFTTAGSVTGAAADVQVLFDEFALGTSHGVDTK